MTSLFREVQNIQNPALGAVLLWRFCCGYSKSHHIAAPPTLPLLFLVLPVILHQSTVELLRRTRTSSGLRTFAAKFGDSKVSKQDLLLQVQDRCRRLRPLTLSSIELAAAGRLLKLTEKGDAVALSVTKVRGLPDDVKQLMSDAEKLGEWFGQLTLHEITTTMKVRL